MRRRSPGFSSLPRRSSPRSGRTRRRWRLLLRRQTCEASQESVLFSAAEERIIMGRKLYVGNLPWSATSKDLQELFSAAGTLERGGGPPRLRLRGDGDDVESKS